ncbi:MAG: methyltransferase, partial [Oscillospiraceae bacterium]|nr:methyltransferase [Oscillospiraceae bacterium]
MSTPKFDPKELIVKGEKPSFFPGNGLPLYDFPGTPADAYRGLYTKNPVWQVSGLEYSMFAPRVNPDNVARAMVVDGSPFEGAPTGGLDMFGVEWEFIPQVGGSIVHPGKPLFTDANDWEKKIKWPDVDSWDWAGNAKQNESY